MYQFKTEIRYSQIDAEGRLTPRAIIDLFQDCVNFHSKSVGASIEYFKEKRKVWVLLSWQIVIDDYPTMGDEVLVWTQPYNFTPMYGMRNFMLKSPEGRIYVRANSIWTMVDIDTGRILRVTPEDAEMYGIGEKIDMEYAPRKLPVPKEPAAGEPVRVMKYHLDTNNHMNNCQYVQLATEYLPDDFDIGQIRVEYKNSAKYGDILVPYYELQEDGLAVELKSAEDEKIFAIVYLERRKA